MRRSAREAERSSWPCRTASSRSNTLNPRAIRIRMTTTNPTTEPVSRKGEPPAEPSRARPWSRRLAKSQRRFLDRDDRVGRNASGDGHAGSNHRMGADDRVAAQDRGVGIDHDLAFDRGVPLRAPHEVAAGVLLEAERPERHALVKPDMI